MDYIPITTTLSRCGTYRDFLHRYVEQVQPEAIAAWSAAHEGRPPVGTMAFIGINPSTADASKDDQTIKKMCGFAARSGFEEIIVGNVFRYRETDVKRVAAHYDAMHHADRELAFLDDEAAWQRIADECQAVTLCWGNRDKVPKRLHHRIDACNAFFRGHPAVRLYNLGETTGGDPLHPQMLGYARPFIRLNPTEE